jgi:hypothetical protein
MFHCVNIVNKQVDIGKVVKCTFNNKWIVNWQYFIISTTNFCAFLLLILYKYYAKLIRSFVNISNSFKILHSSRFSKSYWVTMLFFATFFAWKIIIALTLSNKQHFTWHASYFFHNSPNLFWIISKFSRIIILFASTHFTSFTT